MTGTRTLSPAVLLLAVLAVGAAGPATAGQRTASLSVTVQVVASCGAATAFGALSGHACVGASPPVAVLREIGPAATAAVAQPTGGAPMARSQEEQGIVTVIY
jgi:hypothetical protein